MFSSKCKDWHIVFEVSFGLSSGLTAGYYTTVGVVHCIKVLIVSVFGV